MTYSKTNWQNNVTKLSATNMNKIESQLEKSIDTDGGQTINGTLTTTGNLTSSRFISNVAQGTAPLGVTSKTVVTNLNTDLLDGYHASDIIQFTVGSKIYAYNNLGGF